jgi:hypothetical protein
VPHSLLARPVVICSAHLLVSPVLLKAKRVLLGFNLIPAVIVEFNAARNAASD